MKIKVLFISNFSKAVTGFGKNMKNILSELHKDERFEIVEAANGVRFGADLRTPWKSHGTYPNNYSVLSQIENDPFKKRLAEYGNSTIDDIIKIERPDIVVGIEDIWAFDWASRKWFDKLSTIIWTTLDSVPILEVAYDLAPKVDKFLVWASFAEKEMNKRKGMNVETLHGAIDLSSFYPLLPAERERLRKRHNLTDSFLIGFVFKNQLRKSVPNLLEGFKKFKQNNPNAKLLLHTDWEPSEASWNIQKYILEKELNPKDILTTYICSNCKDYFIQPYFGEKAKCKSCGSNTLVTKSGILGVSEKDLNEIYNVMDVYCHPFTSGGQELPVQEAKAAGLITLVTNYSCGSDSCFEEQGGLPLDWVEYREPFTQFIKATTCPDSINLNLQKVKDMPKEEKERILENGRKHLAENFCLLKIVDKLKDHLLKLGKTDWDFDFTDKFYNHEYVPHDSLNDLNWLLDLYKGMFYKNFTINDLEIKEGLELIFKEGRGRVLEYLVSAAKHKNAEKEAGSVHFKDFLDGEKSNRIAVVIPESAGDVLMVNALLTNLKKTYPDKQIYVITKKEFFPLIDAHPAIYKMINYQDGLDNLLFLEGQGEHEGFFECAFLPFVGTQRFLNYMHNGKDKIQFSLYE